MKKEGLLGSAFLDESEIEQSLNEFGKAGWELVSMLETLDGLIAVFKQPLGLGAKISNPEKEVHRQPESPMLVKPRETKVEPRRLEEKERRKEGADEIFLIDDFEDERDEPAVEVEKKAVKTVPRESSDVGSIRIE